MSKKVKNVLITLIVVVIGIIAVAQLRKMNRRTAK